MECYFGEEMTQKILEQHTFPDFLARSCHPCWVCLSMSGSEWEKEREVR